MPYLGEIVLVSLIIMICLPAFGELYRTIKKAEMSHITSEEFQAICSWLVGHGIYVNWEDEYDPAPIHERVYVLRRRWISSDSHLDWTKCKGMKFKELYYALHKIRSCEKEAATLGEIRDMLSAVANTSQTRNNVNFWKD